MLIMAAAINSFLFAQKFQCNLRQLDSFYRPIHHFKSYGAIEYFSSPPPPPTSLYAYSHPIW